MILIHQGDCLQSLKHLEDDSVNCCITSPPYWGLRDYGVNGQLGLEKTPDEYVAKMVEVFREVRRVLRDDGTLWLNLGDSYNANYRGGGIESASKKQASNAGTHDFMATKPNKVLGLKPKDLVGIPWRVAFALQADGWYLRQDIIWHKPNPMPESVRDRCTKAHEYIFLLSKSERYYFDSKAMQERALRGHRGSKFDTGKTALHQLDRASTKPRTSANEATRNRRSVWTVTTKPFKGAHFATFPPDLIEPCVLAGSPLGGTVLDPFLGAGTTALVAQRHGRKWVGCELNPDYVEIIKNRLENDRSKNVDSCQLQLV